MKQPPFRQCVDAFILVADWMSRTAAAGAALILAYMVAHIVLEIMLRAIWSTSTFVLDEFIGFAVAASAFLGLAEALRVGKLIKIDLVVSRLTPLGRKIAFAAAAAITAGSVGLLSAYVWRTMSRDYLRGTLSTSIAEVSIWMPTALIFIGLVVFLVQLTAQMARRLLSADSADEGAV